MGYASIRTKTKTEKETTARADARNERKSKLIVCPDCGNEVSQSARSCPHCGRKMARKGGQVMSFLCGAMFGPLGCIVSYCCYGGKGALWSLLGMIVPAAILLIALMQ